MLILVLSTIGILRVEIGRAKGNDKFHTITIKYKTFKYDTNGVKTEERWSTLSTVFSVPVLRAFVQFSTTFERNVIIYDFRRYGSNGEETINYDSLIKFLTFVDNGNLSTVKNTHLMERREIF